MPLRDCAPNELFSPCEQAHTWKGRIPDDWIAWIVWNFEHCDWLDADGRAIVATEVQKHASLGCPDALLEAAATCVQLRKLTDAEVSAPPEELVSHILMSRWRKKFLTEAESRWEMSGATYEQGSEVEVGTSLNLVPRASNVQFWVTFATAAVALPPSFAETVTKLGLAWPKNEAIIRVEIPKTGAREFYIPTVLDGIGMYQKPKTPNIDWRARPLSEKGTKEPWGVARDMMTGKAGLPELIAYLTKQTLPARVEKGLETDLTRRPFLERAP